MIELSQPMPFHQFAFYFVIFMLLVVLVLFIYKSYAQLTRINRLLDSTIRLREETEIEFEKIHLYDSLVHNGMDTEKLTVTLKFDTLKELEKFTISHKSTFKVLNFKSK